MRGERPGYLGGPENRVEQPGEAGFEVLVAQRVQAGGPLVSLADYAGLAENLEVMRASGLGHRHVEAGAGLLGVRGQCGDHLQPHRVAEGMQHGAQLELLAGGVGDVLLYDSHRTSDKVRQSSYNVRQQKTAGST